MEIDSASVIMKGFGILDCLAKVIENDCAEFLQGRNGDDLINAVMLMLQDLTVGGIDGVDMIVGCSKVSAGCKNCYAMHMAARLEAMGVESYNGLATKTHGKVNWTGEVRFVKSALDKPLHWKKPCRVFVNSMGDLFHPDVPFEWVDKVLDIIRRCPQHQFQILTKHVETMNRYNEMHEGKIPDNVWLGASIANETEKKARLECLRCIHHPHLFISFEPLIGSVANIDLKGIKWAIVGGESGKCARPMNPAWVQEIYHACQKSGTAFFFKQWGAYGEDGKKRSKKANGNIWQGHKWTAIGSEINRWRVR